jgi:hypothetical protein
VIRRRQQGWQNGWNADWPEGGFLYSSGYQIDCFPRAITDFVKISATLPSVFSCFHQMQLEGRRFIAYKHGTGASSMRASGKISEHLDTAGD